MALRCFTDCAAEGHASSSPESEGQLSEPVLSSWLSQQASNECPCIDTECIILSAVSEVGGSLLSQFFAELWDVMSVGPILC